MMKRALNLVLLLLLLMTGYAVWANPSTAAWMKVYLLGVLVAYPIGYERFALALHEVSSIRWLNLMHIGLYYCPFEEGYTTTRPTWWTFIAFILYTWVLTPLASWLGVALASWTLYRAFRSRTADRGGSDEVRRLRLRVETVPLSRKGMFEWKEEMLMALEVSGLGGAFDRKALASR